MTTPALTGKDGVVNIGGVIAEVTQWSMDRNTEAVEATSMTSGGNREFVAGLFGWSGTFTLLKFINKTGAQAAATFQVAAAAGTASPKFSGSILITNEPVTVPVDGRVEYAYTFTGTGANTAATA